MSLHEFTTPGESAAEERAWVVVRTAFDQREPLPTRRHGSLLVAVTALTLLLGVVAATFSPPGRAVVDHVRRAVGIERAAPALFSLPSGGRLLVASDPGVWVVNADGTKRLLRGYREASWSPFGRFIVATRPNELAALEPDGTVRWTIARRHVRFPRWGGSRVDTRIAYLSGETLRVVSGDGRGDRPLHAQAKPVAPAWRPGAGFVLAYVDRSGRVVVEDVDRGEVLWRVKVQGIADDLRWSSDGRRLLVGGSNGVAVLTREGKLFTAFVARPATATAMAVRPGSHEQSVAVKRVTRSTVVQIGEPAGELFTGAGTFDALTWAPDGDWLLISWPAADQWVFVRPDGKRIRAVANLSSQFRSRAFPHVEGWCCTGSAVTEVH